MVSERLVNCPPQLAPPLMRALFDEIKDASEGGITQVGAWKCRDSDHMEVQQITRARQRPAV